MAEAQQAGAAKKAAPAKRKAAPKKKAAPAQPVQVAATPKKVAIVGFTPTRTQAPFADRDFEIWALNALYKYPDVPRASRWFDLHALDIIPPDRLAAYAGMPCPVFLQDKTPKVPNSVKFPAEKLRSRFGGYWTNSISWMVGLALLEGFTEIHIYGVDMAQDTEYRHQRNNLEYFLGMARGMGVTVYVPPTSDLLMATHEYGYGSDGGLRRKLKERREELAKRVQGLEQQTGKMQQEKLVLDGALQNLTWMINSLTVADVDSMEPLHPEIPGVAGPTV